MKSLGMLLFRTKTVLFRGEGASPHIILELSKNFLDLCTKIHVFLGKLGSVIREKAKDIFRNQNLPITFRGCTNTNGGNRQGFSNLSCSRLKNPFDQNGKGTNRLKSFCLLNQCLDCGVITPLSLKTSQRIGMLWQKANVRHHWYPALDQELGCFNKFKTSFNFYSLRSCFG